MSDSRHATGRIAHIFTVSNKHKNQNTMKIETAIVNCRVTMRETKEKEIYYIEQSEDKRFYITSTKGYNGFEGDGHHELSQAIMEVKQLMKNTAECL